MTPRHPGLSGSLVVMTVRTGRVRPVRSRYRATRYVEDA
jgi:hypothetical protein